MSSVLGFAPLPPAGLAAATAALRSVGFAQEAILLDYRFPTSSSTTVVANALAFAHPTQRTPADYAAFSVFNHANGASSADAVRVLSRSGAPFHLLHRGDRFHLWVSSVTDEGAHPTGRPIIEDVSYDRLGAALAEYGPDLAPEHIVDVKHGRDRFRHPDFADVSPLQLALWVVDVTRPILKERFSSAVDALRRAKAVAQSDTDVTMTAVRLLGAVVLADTGALGDSVRRHAENISLDALMAHAAERFERYFRPLSARELAEADQAYTLLRGVSYAGFEPEMLIELYTAAYTRDERRELGRFDTPMYLTRRIWERLPVELLPPERRIVCDMTAGWGSFLIAGHERLNRLHDMKRRSLRDHLVGNDISESAALLAGLGLLLSTLEDSWHVDHADAITWPWLHDNQPDIIVGNPPFAGDRKRGSVGQRIQRADAFAEFAVERLRPGGLLAMILPRNFVVAESSPSLRAKLLSQCDVLELWELPDKAFADAKVRTSVLFARKHATTGTKLRAPVVVRTVQANTLDRFKESALFTVSRTVPDQFTRSEVPSPAGRRRLRNTHLMEYQLVLSAGEWSALRERCIPVSQIAHIFNGCVIGDATKRGRPTPGVPSRPVNFLQQAKQVIPQSYALSYETAEQRRYPDEFEEPRLQHRDVLAGPKVLLSAISDPSWGRRVKVAIERRGYFVAHNFWVAAPRRDAAARNNVTLEVLAAVLDSPVSNAWLIEHLRSTSLPGRRAVRTLPFPPISLEQRDTITNAVREIERALNGVAAARNQAHYATATIDRVLRAAYGIDEVTWARLHQVLAWGAEAPASLDPPANSDATWRVDGVVTAINEDAETVTLQLTGFERAQTVSITANMPGWLLRPGIPFRATVTREARRAQHVSAGTEFGDFAVMPYAYLDEAALLESLAEITSGV